MNQKSYDYAIVGAGAAGLQLALAFHHDPYFVDKKILMLDSDPKVKNDKTWCFWEKGDGLYDTILFRRWEMGKFITPKLDLDLSLSPYRYKMLRAQDFYQYARKILKKNPTIHWIQDRIFDVSGNGTMKIQGEKGIYKAKYVFDSRIPPDFDGNKGQDHYIRILQHFRGWIIETADPVFDPEHFTMMDFRLKWNNQTSFTYILPFSTHEALVEFTLFDQQLLDDEAYDRMLKAYIERYLKILDYQVKMVEKGVIPMSNFPFHKHHQAGLSKIGTAGGWVRPSTGYSFKNAGKYAQTILRNLKAKSVPHQGIVQKKTRFYDTILLDILANRNELGESIFTDMYAKNKLIDIFEFLDGESTIWQDLKILSRFKSGPFVAALWRQVKRRI